MRRTLAFGLCALALSACEGKNSAKSGPVVAKGKGFSITAGEFKARLDEQSPFMRARYNDLARKKEFLDNLVRFEVLAAEAERQGLAKDPDVQLTLKKVMVQKLVQQRFQDPKEGASSIPDADVEKYYEDHKSEYQRPKRMRLAAVTFQSDAGSPDRAKDLSAAKKALAKLKAEEKKSPLAFNQVVTEFSEDGATKASGGDLGFKTREEITSAFTPEFADAAFAMKPGETSGVLETPRGVYIVKVLGQQEEVNRTLEQMKTQIVNKLNRERRTKEFDEFVKKLREEAGITIDEKELEKVEVAAGPAPGAPGMPGMPHGGVAPAPMPAPAPASTPPPASTPAPAPAPASKPAPAPAPVKQ
jgi:peptidyl-prolyl cis-trans isomerase C